MLCISTAAKNMINALFASKEGGARRFQSADEISFGWKAVTGKHKRECRRRDGGHARAT